MSWFLYEEDQDLYVGSHSITDKVVTSGEFVFGPSIQLQELDRAYPFASQEEAEARKQVLEEVFDYPLLVVEKNNDEMPAMWSGSIQLPSLHPENSPQQ